MTKKEIIAQVKKTTYYRGISKKKPKLRRSAPYFTKHKKEATLYSKVANGDIIEVKISPKNPLLSQNLPDAAKKLGLYNKDFESLLVVNNGIGADNVVNAEARNRGFDSFIRREGDYVIPLDANIIKEVKGKRGLKMGKVIKVKGTEYFKKGQSYSCKLVTAGKGAKVLQCHKQNMSGLGLLSGSPMMATSKHKDVKINDHEYRCTMYEVITPTKGKGLQLRCQLLSKVIKTQALNVLISRSQIPVEWSDSHRFWGKVLTGIDFNQEKGYAFEGKFFGRDQYSRLPVGSLILWYHEEGSRKYHYPYVELYRVMGKGKKREGTLKLIKKWQELPKGSWSEPIKNWIAENVPEIPVKG